VAQGKYINIYTLSSVDNPNEVKYVGVTKYKPSYRLSSHIYEAKNKPDITPKTKWVNEIRFKLVQNVIDVVEERDADFWEKYWIGKMTALGFNLVNSNKGGGGLSKRDEEFSMWLSERNMGNKYNLGKTHSKETKMKMSLSKVGKESPRKGCTLSDETKMKMSVAKIGKRGNASGVKHTYETRRKKMKSVIQMDINGSEIKLWGSMSGAAKELGLDNGKITLVCQGKRQTTGGFKWKYCG